MLGTGTFDRRSDAGSPRRGAPVLAAAALACLGLGPQTAAAQALDVAALIADIDARAGQYEALTGILQGSDPTRALAAFDVMLETGDKTLRETAISAAMTATDERLRARALWETLAQKDSITLAIATDGLDDDARAALDGWVGAVSTWAITARLPDTQCLNLYGTGDCETSYHLSVSGLKVDMRYDNRIEGGFVLTPEGLLSGEVANPRTKAVYPATIALR